jgi:AcrR family transcriptional regulator
VAAAARPRSSSLAALALDGDAPPDPLGDRILDAALEQFRLVGIRRSSIDDVARRAGAGRVTVFRRFGTKDGLVRALALRECRRLVELIDAAIAPLDALEDRIVEGFVVGLRAARRHPLVTGLLETEPETVLPLFTTEAGEALRFVRAVVARDLRAASTGGDPEQAAELLARMGLSFLLTTDTTLPLDDDRRVRELARRHLVPLVLGCPKGSR